MSNKSFVPDEFISLFQESDRGERRNNVNVDDSEEVEYRASRAVILHRMDLLGYTSQVARRNFEEWLAAERAHYAELTQEEGGDWASETSNALQHLDYEGWLRRAKEVFRTRYDFSRQGEFTDEIDRYMRDTNDGWLFYSDDVLPILRSFLDAFTEIQDVTLDIGALIGGGWIEATEKICENRRASISAQPRHSVLQPVVIMAEGSSDITVLRRSLEKLYPYLIDYFTFFDYDGSNADASASYLVKFLRAFAAARINATVIAIFDNDSVGHEAFNQALGTNLPANLKIARLPDIDLARSYPSIGPQGAHAVDINGSAVSIEIFLGRHNICTDDGELIPIMWSNYVAGVGRYQGAIAEKKALLKRFLEDTAPSNTAEFYRERFPELTALWQHIFGILGGRPTPHREEQKSA